MSLAEIPRVIETGPEARVVTKNIRNLDIMVYGGGIFAEQVLAGLRDEKWARVNWYFPSSVEARKFRGLRYINKKDPQRSYNGIINARNLDVMEANGRLIVHEDGESFFDCCDHTDLFLFLSGPHTQYKKKGENIRGKDSEGFYHDEFRDALPKLRICSESLNKRGYRKAFWPVSNPVGASLLAAQRLGATLPEQISSVTCDGYRAAKLIALELFLDHGIKKRLGLTELPVDRICEFPIVGEHHNPEYIFDYCFIRTENPGEEERLERLNDLLPDTTSQDFRDKFKKRLEEKAIKTMQYSSVHPGYNEAPETLVRALKSLAFCHQLYGYDTVYHLNQGLGTYLIELVKYDFDQERFVEDKKAKMTLTDEEKNTLEEHADKQKALVDSLI